VIPEVWIKRPWQKAQKNGERFHARRFWGVSSVVVYKAAEITVIIQIGPERPNPK
jgi:hypothetical protein